MRVWRLVDIHTAYLEAIMAEGTLGHRCLIGGDLELTNNELLKQIQFVFNLRCPDEAQDF